MTNYTTRSGKTNKDTSINICLCHAVDTVKSIHALREEILTSIQQFEQIKEIVEVFVKFQNQLKSQ